jgi:hypothetical protein
MLDKLGVQLNEAGEYKNYQDVAFKLDIPMPGNGRFTVFGIGGLSRSDKQNSSLQRYNRADVGVAGATYQKTVSGNTTLLTTLSWSGTNISNYYEVGLDTGVLKVHEDYAKSYLRGAVMGEQKVSERFFLKGGVTYSRLFYNFYLRNQDPKNDAYQDILNFLERDNTGITQAFLTANQNFSSTVSGVYGIHFIHFGLTNDYAVEPRVGLRWEATPGKVFSVGYG